MTLGSLESQIMDVLWAARNPLTVRQTLDALNRDRDPKLAYTTVLTVMSRLADKGALVRTPLGRGHAYTPVAADEPALAVQGVLRTYGDAAVSYFLDHAATDPALRQRLQALQEKDS